jgi:hypothetical protein
MAKKTIRHVFYRYRDEEGKPQTAYQGDKVDLSDAEIERGTALGAFEGTDPVTAASREPVPSEREPHESPQAANRIDGDYESHTAPRLQQEADRRGLDVTGTGANGNVLKDDLVDALLAHDAGDDTPQ